MALKHFKGLLKNSFCHLQYRLFSQKYEYEIPESYRNAFYLANASLVDTTNWFLHNALGVIYEELIDELERRGHSTSESINQISNILNVLEPCNQIIDLRFPIKTENKKYRIFRGFRAQHGLYINKNPCLGGLRLHPMTRKDDLRGLAAISTYKYACMGIDMLGAYGAILISPNELKQQELQKVLETYMMELTKRKFCGECLDIIEPDINCGPNEIKWIIAGYSKVRGNMGNTCAVGKPVTFGGIENSDKVVGQGIFFGLDHFLNDRNLMDKLELSTGWNNKTFVLQGLGKVGSCTAIYLASAGVKCIGIVDEDCYIHHDNGINVEDALAYKHQYGSLNGFMSYTKTDEPGQALCSDCDILILAALENSLPYYIANKIKAKIVIEAANAPIPPLVHKVLLGSGKLVLPDIFINSGSSIAAYLEYTKNLQRIPVTFSQSHANEMVLQWLDNKVSYKLLSCNQSNSNCLITYCSELNGVTRIVDDIMKKTVKDVLTIAQQYNLELDLRTAAYIIAIKKLFWNIYDTMKGQHT